MENLSSQVERESKKHPYIDPNQIPLFFTQRPLGIDFWHSLSNWCILSAQEVFIHQLGIKRCSSQSRRVIRLRVNDCSWSKNSESEYRYLQLCLDKLTYVVKGLHRNIDEIFAIRITRWYVQTMRPFYNSDVNLRGGENGFWVCLGWVWRGSRRYKSICEQIVNFQGLNCTAYNNGMYILSVTQYNITLSTQYKWCLWVLSKIC